jgi:hypothetical protein
MRKLSGDQFADYARQQIAVASQILAHHRPTSSGCSCARQWPCPVALSCQQTRDHFQGRLALLDATIQLPVISPATTDCRSPWRRLVSALFRRARR